MTPPDYAGQERRQDSTSVRLALLERSYFENKDSLVSVHKRITDFKSEVKEDMRIGFQDLKEIIMDFTAKTETRSTLCVTKFNDRITILESWRNWITGAYIATSIIIGAWLNHKGKG